MKSLKMVILLKLVKQILEIPNISSQHGEKKYEIKNFEVRG